MSVLFPYLVLLGFLAVALGFFTLLARRIRRRGTAGGGMSGAPAAYEEAFRTTSHASHYEIRAQAERKVPTDSPDGWRRWRKKG
ncbi:hypothetical protein [Streptomyces hokutonensis]|uniref:hypothetical protein n=1 Tax=Streptomyces hokutonensis TaxID=1306990 RepID=UPI0036B66A34